MRWGGCVAHDDIRWLPCLTACLSTCRHAVQHCHHHHHQRFTSHYSIPFSTLSFLYLTDCWLTLVVNHPPTVPPHFWWTIPIEYLFCCCTILYRKALFCLCRYFQLSFPTFMVETFRKRVSSASSCVHTIAAITWDNTQRYMVDFITISCVLPTSSHDTLSIIFLYLLFHVRCRRTCVYESPCIVNANVVAVILLRTTWMWQSYTTIKKQYIYIFVMRCLLCTLFCVQFRKLKNVICLACINSTTILLRVSRVEADALELHVCSRSIFPFLCRFYVFSHLSLLVCSWPKLLCTVHRFTQKLSTWFCCPTASLLPPTIPPPVSIFL